MNLNIGKKLVFKRLNMQKKTLGVFFTVQYRKFLSECGMCNYSDVNICGIAKDKSKISYPIVDLTIQMRNEVNIPKDLIVLSYEVGEYLTLYARFWNSNIL